MAAKKSSFLEIDPKIIEKNLNFLTKETGTGEGIVDDGPWTLATPKPGFCIKTVDAGNNKVFVNFCILNEIPEPEDVTEDELIEIIESRREEFRFPVGLQEPHEEKDKSGNPVVCYDVGIAPKIYDKVVENPIFKMFAVQVAFNGLEQKYGADLETEDYVTLKNRKCVGTLRPQRIRTSRKSYEAPKQLIEDVTSKQTRQKPMITEIPSKPSNSINYSLKKVEKAGKPFLYAQVELPETLLAKDVDVEIGEDRLIVESRRDGSILDIFLPVNLNEKNSHAAFATSTRTLHIMAPIIT